MDQEVVTAVMAYLEMEKETLFLKTFAGKPITGSKSALESAMPVGRGRRLKNRYLGKWRILEMEQWDQDFIDLTGEGHIIFEKKNRGELHFGAVDCDLDCRIEKVGEQERMEFSFVGVDEGDEVSGRGWAVLECERLNGRIYFHDGEESGFTAGKL